MAGWKNKHDPDNPRNWSRHLKYYHTYIPTIVGFLVTFASTAYVPAQEQVQKYFRVSETIALLPFAFYILGLAFGPLIAAPASEAFGRKPVYHCSVLIFAIFILGSGFCRSLAGLIVCHFLAGAFGGAALVIGFGVLADIWSPAQLPIALSIFNTVPFCGPAVGQLINTFVVANLSWPWTQWTVLFLTSITYVSIIGVRETREETILRRRDIREGRFESTVSSTWLQTIESSLKSIPLVRPVKMLFTEPVVGLLALYIALTFAVVYCFSTSIPFSFAQVYNFTPEAQGLVFVSLIVGYVISAPTMVVPYLIQKRKHEKATHTASSSDSEVVAPELLLFPAMIGCIALPISFFWFAWTARPTVHWICPVISLALFSWGNDLIYNASQLYLLETYGPKYGASASAANSLLRYILATILPLFMKKMYSDLGVDWASSLLGFVCLAFVPLPWALHRYGPFLRAHSHYIKPTGQDQSTPVKV